jgi:hypothetical protein
LHLSPTDDIAINFPLKNWPFLDNLEILRDLERSQRVKIQKTTKTLQKSTKCSILLLENGKKMIFL